MNTTDGIYHNRINQNMNQNTFQKYIQTTFELEKKVKNNQLSEHELILLLDVVDVEIILKYQKLSQDFINQYIFPIILRENKSDPTRIITSNDIERWQKV